jgi:nicotinamide N-methyltransferase
MALGLTSRISLTGPTEEDPEDILSTSLGVIYPDDVTSLHGDADHGLLYTSPHLPRPLQISLSNPQRDEDRRLFSHYLWNSSLLLAEFVEAGTLGLERFGSDPDVSSSPSLHSPVSSFDVTSLEILELGAGTALPSLLASLLGAGEVTVTDYPSPEILANLREVVTLNAIPSNSPLGTTSPISVAGHEWGDLSTPFALENRGRFDRLFVCDCLWMPWQHGKLRKSISWFLKEGIESRAWVVGGFHTGRDTVGMFFDEKELRDEGLEVEMIWERDCDGKEREWVWDDSRGWEDPGVRKRWLVVAILKRVEGER